MKPFSHSEPFNFYHLPVGSGHSIYAEEFGAATGKPVLVLQDGPGFPSQRSFCRLFDPEKWRIVIMDPRGCGKSQWDDPLRDNTTLDLVSDIERLRDELETEKWVLFGFGWGATLATLYAQSFPHRCAAVLLSGRPLFQSSDWKWFYSAHGSGRTFPEPWSKFMGSHAQTEPSRLMEALGRRLAAAGEGERKAAAQTLSQWEDVVGFGSYSTGQTPCWPVRCHYFSEDLFFERDTYLDGTPQTKEIPCFFVHGITPGPKPCTAVEDFQNLWSEGELVSVPDAQNRIEDQGICDALKSCISRLERALKFQSGSYQPLGFVEISDRINEVDTVKNYQGKKIDFVFDHKRNAFVMGDLCKHQGLADHLGIPGEGTAKERKTHFVAGRLSRKNGKLVTDEWSGSFGNLWNEALRAQFLDFFKANGVPVEHKKWPPSVDPDMLRRALAKLALRKKKQQASEEASVSPE